ncbi:MAG: QueT transporter family protein [Actinomycetes bacterium]|nr:QueT transporter family protein [Actinomycetes bacterium]
MSVEKTRTQRLATTGVIAATYAAFSVIAMQTLSMFAWGPVQFRVSEALVILPLFFAEAVPGLAIGCLLANLANIAMASTGAIGLLDVVFGTLATLLGALWTRRFRQHPGIALAGPVVTNAIIVAAYLPIILKGLGYYTIPFTTIALDGSGYLALFLFGVISVGIGEAVVVYALGLPLAALLKRALKL